MIGGVRALATGLALVVATGCGGTSSAGGMVGSDTDAPGSGTTGPTSDGATDDASSGTSDGGTTTSTADEAGLEPGLSQAIAAAIPTLVEMGDEHPHVSLISAVLHRRFGVEAFAGAAAAYDAEVQRNPDDVALYVFRRLIDPLHTVTAGNLEALTAEVDRMTAPALYCDTVPLPDDWVERLEAGADEGQYGATHAGLALAWLDEVGCDDPTEPELRARIVGTMAALANDAPGVWDLPLESGALLHVMGDGERISTQFVEEAIAAQHEGGSWGADVGDVHPSWHATAMGLWLLLEVRDEPLGPSVPQG